MAERSHADGFYDDRAVSDDTIADVGTALTRLACPYYRGTGDRTCVSGCSTEPSCITDQPEGGWMGELRRVVTDA